LTGHFNYRLLVGGFGASRNKGGGVQAVARLRVVDYLARSAGFPDVPRDQGVDGRTANEVLRKAGPTRKARWALLRIKIHGRPRSFVPNPFSARIYFRGVAQERHRGVVFNSNTAKQKRSVIGRMLLDANCQPTRKTSKGSLFAGRGGHRRAAGGA